MRNSAEPITAVVFDFGGVMTTTTMPDRVRPVAAKLGVPWSVLEEGYGRYRRLMDGGFIELSTVYDLILADAGLELKPGDLAEIVREDLASFLYRNERTVRWMKSLRERGLRIGILTNMPPSFVRPFRETFGDFIALADAVVISGEERMYKPQRRIYDLLRQRLGVPAGEILFVDDVEGNCEGARSAGWRALRFESNEQVEREFESLMNR